MNKTQFILSQPFDMPASEVVAAARKAGIKIAPTYVHVTRHKARKSGVAAPKRTALKSAGKPAAAKPDLRLEFSKLAVRIGVDAAQAELDRLVDGIGL